jgi:hypothetical protein
MDCGLGSGSGRCSDDRGRAHWTTEDLRFWGTGLTSHLPPRPIHVSMSCTSLLRSVSVASSALQRLWQQVTTRDDMKCTASPSCHETGRN